MVRPSPCSAGHRRRCELTVVPFGKTEAGPRPFYASFSLCAGSIALRPTTDERRTVVCYQSRRAALGGFNLGLRERTGAHDRYPESYARYAEHCRNVRSERGSTEYGCLEAYRRRCYRRFCPGQHRCRTSCGISSLGQSTSRAEYLSRCRSGGVAGRCVRGGILSPARTTAASCSVLFMAAAMPLGLNP